MGLVKKLLTVGTLATVLALPVSAQKHHKKRTVDDVYYSPKTVLYQDGTREDRSETYGKKRKKLDNILYGSKLMEDKGNGFYVLNPIRLGDQYFYIRVDTYNKKIEYIPRDKAAFIYNAASSQLTDIVSSEAYEEIPFIQDGKQVDWIWYDQGEIIRKNDLYERDGVMVENEKNLTFTKPQILHTEIGDRYFWKSKNGIYFVVPITDRTFFSVHTDENRVYIVNPMTNPKGGIYIFSPRVKE